VRYEPVICGFSEIDQQRGGALRLKEERPPPQLGPASVLPRLARYGAGARSRGITHTTLCSLTEALDLDRSHPADLRRLLITRHPDRFAAPLWRIPPPD
jgi:hypothetical protein